MKKHIFTTLFVYWKLACCSAEIIFRFGTGSLLPTGMKLFLWEMDIWVRWYSEMPGENICN